MHRLGNSKYWLFPNVLAHGKSYEHGFTKKRDGHKLCAKSRAESSFNRFFMHRLGNSKYWPFPIVEFQSIFRALSLKFKILAILDVLDHGKSYEHGFTKNVMVINFHEVASRVEFRSIFHAPSRKFKILANPNVLAHEKSYEYGFVKNMMVINFTQSHAQSQVSIGFTCTISKILNTDHSDVLAHVASRVEFRSVFRAPSRKFKIPANPNILISP
ncbi:hypothetical protein BHE74_00034355 [Ensete ventricosum]|nr:hypothetical protein BHE74_00034355 [Ensete ventricosum]